jgi:hypothetical protein
MKQIPTTVLATVAAALFAPPLLSITSTAARAYDYCYQDVTGHMKGSSFDTMEQCEATRSGRGGDCFRDPFLKDSNNAYAYQPKYPGSGRPGRAAGARHRQTGR